MRRAKTGTGFAYAKLSQTRSSPRVAQVVRVTERAQTVPGGQKRFPWLVLVVSSRVTKRFEVHRVNSGITSFAKKSIVSGIRKFRKK